MFALPTRLLNFVIAVFATLPVAVVPQFATAQSVELPRGVPYLTNRNVTGASGPSEYYGDERNGLGAGWCYIGETKFNGMASLIEIAPFHIPDEILRVDSISVSPPDELLGSLGTTAQDGPLLLYTHGFYIDFEKGCRRATVFQENVDLQGRFMWFSWPSDGSLTNYTHDEADLYWSVPDLAKVIVDMEQRFGGERINLAGHSLGARGLVLALDEVVTRNPDLRLGEVILLAPDMDFDIFARILPRIRPIARGITIYVSDTDRPLALSAQVHGYPRLGESGNDVASLEGVEVIELSDLPMRSPTGHLYHVYNKEVGDDLSQLLDQGKRAGQRRNMEPVGSNLWALQPVD